VAARPSLVKASSAHSYGHGEVVRAAGRLIEWAQSAPPTRPEDEYIHELRVRLRRCRAAMRAFRRFYRSRGAYERRVERLRRLSRALGPLRDSDVTAGLLEDALKTAPHAPRAVVSMLERHRHARERRWTRVLPALAAIAGLAPEALAPPRPPPGEKAPRGKRRLDRHARATLARRFNEVWRLRRVLESRDPLELHALRIEIKRLRYSVEAFDAITGAAGRRWGAALKKLQSTLGVINDHTVALSVVERFLQSEARPMEAAALQRLAATLEAHRDFVVARFLVEWRQADPTRMRALIQTL